MKGSLKLLTLLSLIFFACAEEETTPKVMVKMNFNNESKLLLQFQKNI
jgi:hypothetical protein